MSQFTESGFWRKAKPYESDQSNLKTSIESTTPHDESLQMLRRQLIGLDAWPEAGDAFLTLLEQARGYGATLVPADYEWLGQVADSACKGEDIGTLYPSIFQKLLTFPDLRRKFLQALHIRNVGV